ncbi:hypothetical protein BSKO_10069 [Bryopsis sp. KO-2023]|nr:hypothetical protein BSKO_10069 [Bryopsis sp. KO-2023]
MSAFALFLVACVLVAAQAGEVPSSEACDNSAMAMGVDDFVLRALGGDASCVDAENKGGSAGCLEKEELLNSVSDHRSRSECLCRLGLLGQFVLSVSLTVVGMCNVDFFSGIMMALPAHSNIDPTRYVDMLEKCGVPVAGKTTCPGVDEETPVEPVMQAQILLKKKKKIIGALALKAAAGKALAARRRAPPPRDVESSSTTVVEDDPVPEPTPPPVKPVYDPGISRINAVVEFLP